MGYVGATWLRWLIRNRDYGVLSLATALDSRSGSCRVSVLFFDPNSAQSESGSKVPHFHSEVKNTSDLYLHCKSFVRSLISLWRIMKNKK